MTTENIVDEATPPATFTTDAPSTPTTITRTKAEACLWSLFGIAGAYGGAALAIPLTTPSVEASSDDFAGLLYLLTIPLGFVVGTIVACSIAANIERESRSAEDLFTRTELTFFGVLLPILLVVAASALSGAVG